MFLIKITSDQHTFFYIIHIVTAKTLMIQDYFRPSFRNLGCPRYSHYIVIITSNVCVYSFRREFYSISKNVINACGWSCSFTVLVKMWSMHVDDLVPVVFVNTLVGWLITWIRLQAVGSEASCWADSLMKDSQYSGPKESTPLCLHQRAFHTHYLDTDCWHLVAYSNTPK